LLARVDGKVYAVSPKCSHFGVNLKYGMLVGDRVYCPAHTASFSVITGYPDGGPVLKGLQTYETWEEDGKIYVKAPKVITSHHKTMPMAKHDLTNLQRYVIVGGGVSALSAAEALRQSGFTGEIMMVSGEQWLPYDRTMGSKNIMGMNPEKIQLRSREWLNEHGINVQLNSRVTKVESSQKMVIVDDGKGEQCMKYDKLLIATGCRPRATTAPGGGLPNVFQLNDADDAVKVKDCLENLGSGKKRVVVFGAGYVGMEAAASLKEKFKEDIEVTIVNRGQVVMDNSMLGGQVGGALVWLHETNGTKFMTGRTLKSVNEKDGSAYSVTLDNGDIINANAVSMSQGVLPNTEFTDE
jgi:NAD(P)H-nitrite reductase large subunit/nitrite reductase/ring-hydroxylating ferredoxin subunit